MFCLCILLLASGKLGKKERERLKFKQRNPKRFLFLMTFGEVKIAGTKCIPALEMKGFYPEGEQMILSFLEDTILKRCLSNHIPQGLGVMLCRKAELQLSK